MEKVLRWIQANAMFSFSQERSPLKIIDWYLMREVCVPLFYSLFAFILLFVVYDLSINFNEIFDHAVGVHVLLKYYFVSIPGIFVNSAPVAVLMATLYCLGSLGAHNEITAMQANGIGLRRVSVPFVVVGLGMSLLVFLVNEKLVPRFSEVSEMVRQEEIKKKSLEEQDIWREFAYQNPHTQRSWVGAYDPNKKILKEAVIREFRADGSLEAKYSAAEARWVEGSWWLLDGNWTLFDRENKQVSVENFSKRELRFPGKKYEIPEDLANARKETQLMSIPELKEHMKLHNRKDAVYHSEKVDLHYKIAFPFISLVVVFLGVPLGLRHSGRRGSALAGFGISLGLCLSYYAFTLITLSVGKQGWLPAWLAAWLPNFLFIGIGMSNGVKVLRR